MHQSLIERRQITLHDLLEVDINARPGILLVLPGDTPDNLAVFAVALNCSAADTGLLANTQVPRP